MMTVGHVRNRLKGLVLECGSQRAAGTSLGISQAHLCDILRGHREPGLKTLEALGLEEFTGYRLRATCACTARRCPAHPGRACADRAVLTVARVRFCEACAEDALKAEVSA